MKINLVKNSTFYIAIGLLPVTISFITLPILTRFLTPEDYGILSMIAVFTSLVSIVTSLQIHSGVKRLYFDYDDQKKRVYFSTLIYTMTCISCSVLASLFFIGDEFVKMLYSQNDYDFWPIFFIATVNICFSISISLTTAFFKTRGEGKPLLIISAFGSILSTALILYLVVFEKMGLMGSLCGSALGIAATYAMHLFKFRSEFVFSFNSRMLLQNLKFGVPVIPHALGGFLFMYSDIIILEKFVEISLIGVYLIADKFSRLLKIFVNSFATAFSPIFMESCKSSVEEGKELVLDTSKTWFVLLGMGYVVLCHVGEYAIYLMTPSSFHEAALILPILALAYVLRGIYILPINTFYFTKKTKYLPVATVTSGLANILLNLILIPKLGILGAAISTAVCFLLNWVFLEFLCKKSFIVPRDKKSLYFLVGLCVISNGVFFCVAPHGYIRYCLQILLLVGMFLFIWRANLGSVRVFIIGKFFER